MLPKPRRSQDADCDNFVLAIDIELDDTTSARICAQPVN
jgi:hypothetical protein